MPPVLTFAHMQHALDVLQAFDPTHEFRLDGVIAAHYLDALGQPHSVYIMRPRARVVRAVLD